LSSAAARWRGDSRGFTLVEVLAALGLLVSAGIVATLGAVAMLRLERAAHAEAVGLALASERLEELLAQAPAARLGGNDETELDGITVVRVWRVVADEPAPGLTRLEVSARWDHPRTTSLTLVAAAPSGSAS
jgi:type II secretory pathway pseudopilin PulG